MADFIDLVCRRFSVRRYKPDPVPEESLHKVLEAGRHAPSACNFQPWHILVVRDEEKRKACYAFYPQSWFVEAPVILGVFVDTSRAWKRSDGVSYAMVDAAIIMDHMILQATELGLGTCWIGAFKPDIVRQQFALPEHIEPVAFTPLGYPACDPGPHKRKRPEEIVHYDEFRINPNM